jgi:FMN phosphatase YigB (HAD superfamily)
MWMRIATVLFVDDSQQIVQGAIAFGLHACRYISPDTLPRELMKYGLSTAWP